MLARWLLLTPFVLRSDTFQQVLTPRRECVVQASGDASIDDAGAIVQAFEDCGKGGRVIFPKGTYHINSVMNTTGLENCEVQLHGRLLVRSQPNSHSPQNLLMSCLRLNSGQRTLRTG